MRSAYNRKQSPSSKQFDSRGTENIKYELIFI